MVEIKRNAHSEEYAVVLDNCKLCVSFTAHVCNPHAENSVGQVKDKEQKHEAYNNINDLQS